MWTDERGVLGVGYEGETLESFVEKLCAWKIALLVDVRLNALSRKRGFSKNALRDALGAAGIEYLHAPELGNPKTNREGYAERRTAAGDASRDAYRARLTSDDAQAALQRIVAASRRQHVAIFCFEANGYHCHREQVIEAVDRLGAAVPA